MLGAVNDKSIVKFDKYLSQALRNDLFARITYKLCDKDGNEYETESAYLIVDNGYLKNGKQQYIMREQMDCMISKT